MKKDFKYVAPEAEILSAQVEKGVYSSDLPSGPGEIPGEI